MIISRFASTVRGRAFGMLAVAFVTLCTQPHTAKTLKIATASPAGSSWMQVLGDAAAEVDAATDGRVGFKFYPGGVMGDDTTVLRKMRAGQLHGGIVVTAVFGNLYTDIQAYNLPMVFRDLAEVDAVRETMDPMLIAGLAEAGFVAFGIAELGMAYAMSTKPARTVADARRLKVWAPQGDRPAARMLEAFRIAPIPLTIADVLGSLQTGLIDTVAAPPVAALPLFWHTRLKYVLDLPFMYVYGVFVVSERSLRGIAAADLAALQRIMGAAVVRVDKRNRADHDSAWQALENQGLEVIRLTPAEAAEWRSYARKAAAQWVADGIVSQPVYGALMKRLAEVRGQAPATPPAASIRAAPAIGP